MRKCKYKKIYSKGKKHPTHFQRRSFKEQCRKYNKYKKNKTKHINLSKSKNPYRNNPHNTNIDGIINFPKCINKLDQIIKDIKSRTGKYSISINHKNLDEIDNTSILILTASISDINSNIKTFIKNKKLKPKAEIDERLSAIGYWDALCINHKTKKDVTMEMPKFDFSKEGEDIKNNFTTDDLKTMYQLVDIEYPFE